MDKNTLINMIGGLNISKRQIDITISNLKFELKTLLESDKK